MASEKLAGKRIALLVTDGFEEVELTGPAKALRDEGAEVLVVSPDKEHVRAWSENEWSREYPVDVSLSEARSEEFDGLVLPGGVMNPDRLRRDRMAMEFVRSFFEDGKPIGAICHGPWSLIEVGAARGRNLTSFKSLRTDLVNAGAHWINAEVVVDDGIVTSRTPEDLPAFNAKCIEELSAGVHERTDASRGERPAL